MVEWCRAPPLERFFELNIAEQSHACVGELTEEAE
jgi:hypothetical protein